MGLVKINIGQAESVEPEAARQETPKEGTKVKVEWNIKNRGKYPQEIQTAIIKSRLLCLLCIIPGAIVSALEVLLMLKVSDLTDASLQGDTAVVFDIVGAAIIFLAIMLPIFFFSCICNAFYRKKSITMLKKAYLSMITKLPINCFDERNSSDYLTAMTNHADSIDQSYLASVFGVMQGVISLLAGIYLAINISIAFLITSIVILVLIYAVIQIIVSSDSLYTVLVEKIEGVNQKTKEIISGFDLIWRNNLQAVVLKQYNKEVSELKDINIRVDKRTGLIGIIASVLGSAVMFGFFIISVLEVMNGKSSMGHVIFMLTSFLLVLQPGISLFQNVPSIKEGKAALEKISILPAFDNNESVGFDGAFNRIELENVSARYGEKTIFSKVNIQIDKGDKILLIGPSGCGKSTFLKILRKYMQASEGRILVDGVDLNSIYSKDWFRQTAFLSQRLFLFDDTISNNITLKKDFDAEKLQKVIEMSGLSDFIKNRENGICDRIIDGGINVSGGEKMRIAIARALYQDAQILLLDEPFSSLDTETALSIERQLLKMDDVLVINVSHVIFPETREMYDRVIEMKGGG